MRYFLILIFMWLCFLAEAQLFIPSKKLEVSANKTTNLIFPSTINSVDRGSERIMVQKINRLYSSCKSRYRFLRYNQSNRYHY